MQERSQAPVLSVTWRCVVLGYAGGNGVSGPATCVPLSSESSPTWSISPPSEDGRERQSQEQAYLRERNQGLQTGFSNQEVGSQLGAVGQMLSRCQALLCRQVRLVLCGP